MRSRQSIVTILTAAAVASIVFPAGAFLHQAVADNASSKAPGHRVAVYYFHRTQRCPTCRMIGSYVEEAVAQGLAKEVKDRTVSLHFIDFQDPKNKQYTDYYEIKGPSLVVVDVHDGKVTAWKPAPKVWTLVAKKDEFLGYVRGEVRAYLEAE